MNNCISRSLRSVMVLALLLLGLAGCSRTVWQKPGATQSEYEQIKAACMLEGIRNVPQDNRTVLLSDGVQYTTDKCHKGHECRTITHFTPPQYGVRDMNENIRDQVMRACMFRNGWTEVVIEQ